VRVASDQRGAYGLSRTRPAEIQTAYDDLRAYHARFPGDDAAARAAYDIDLAGTVLGGREKDEGGNAGMATEMIGLRSLCVRASCTSWEACFLIGYARGGARCEFSSL
jgi:hypothetical protein